MKQISPQRESTNESRAEPADSPGLQKCADCLHAKLFKDVSASTGRYLLKVRCSRGHWPSGRKHGGAVDLHRILSRRKHNCPDYSSMSDDDEDRKRYLADLARDLPYERILYEPNGEPVDMTEVVRCCDM
jgi:hypothetical protein